MIMSSTLQAITYIQLFPVLSAGCSERGQRFRSAPVLPGGSGSSSHLTAAAAISPVLLGQRWMETDLPAV